MQFKNLCLSCLEDWWSGPYVIERNRRNVRASFIFAFWLLRQLCFRGVQIKSNQISHLFAQQITSKQSLTAYFPCVRSTSLRMLHALTCVS